VRPETRPELGSFYRADHFEFAKVGVPVVYVERRQRLYRQAESYARDRVDEYIAQRYHKVTDTVRSDWNLEGAVEDAGLLFMVGYDVAQGTEVPQMERQGLSSSEATSDKKATPAEWAATRKA